MIEELVTVKRSKRSRRVALRLDPIERVINLVIPEKMPLRTAYTFARAHEDWIQNTLSTLPPAVPFTHGTVLPIFGDHVTIDINHDPTCKRISIKQYDDRLCVHSYTPEPANRITTHLKKIGRAGLADIANEKAESINTTLTSISVRDTKSRWGSCSHDGQLSFSWRLIFAPYNAIDYVVAHEVAHRIHMDHSRAFWQLCESLCIDYAEGKSWMKRNGNTLMRYGYTQA